MTLDLLTVILLLDLLIFVPSWLVHLANGTKRKVSEMVEKCPFVMDVLVTYADLMFYYLVPMISSLEWISWKHTEYNLIITTRLLNA